MAACVLGIREKTVLALSLGTGLAPNAALVFIVALFRPPSERTTAHPVISQLLIGTGAIYMLITAIGRPFADIEAAFMWRYPPEPLASFLVLFFFLLQPLPPPSATARLAMTGSATILALLLWRGFTRKKSPP